MTEKLNIPHAPALHVIIPMTAAQHTIALLLADELRAHSIATDIIFEGSMKSMMRKASSLGASHVLIIGETEQQNRTVMLKNMVNGTEQEIAQVDAVKMLKRCMKIM